MHLLACCQHFVDFLLEMLCECVREVDIWFTYISAYVLIYWAGFVVISCEDNAGSWCDVTDHDVDPFPTLINFADGRETLTGCAESILDHWFIHSFIAVLFSPNQVIDFNQASFFLHPPLGSWKKNQISPLHWCLWMFIHVCTTYLSQMSWQCSVTLNRLISGLAA